LDKYTAWNAAYSLGGVFVWVKEGVEVTWPIQACFYLEKMGLGQLVRILIVAEPHSKVHLITGCVMHPRCETALHGCISEVYVGKGAEVTFSFIHNFKPKFHIRPKVGVMVDEDGTYRENYILTSPVKSTQLYPTVILGGAELEGKHAQPSLRTRLIKHRCRRMHHLPSRGHEGGDNVKVSCDG